MTPKKYEKNICCSPPPIPVQIIFCDFLLQKLWELLILQKTEKCMELHTFLGWPRFFARPRFLAHALEGLAHACAVRWSTHISASGTLLKRKEMTQKSIAHLAFLFRGRSLKLPAQGTQESTTGMHSPLSPSFLFSLLFLFPLSPSFPSF
jgi:hypothetical protein